MHWTSQRAAAPVIELQFSGHADLIILSAPQGNSVWDPSNIVNLGLRHARSTLPA